MDYWKKAALEILDENERNQLQDSAPLSLLLICKAKKNNAKKASINEMILYLKSQYSANIRNQIVLIQDFPGLEEVPFFEGIQEELKMVLKYIDYIRLYKLMSIASKLLNCQVSMSYFAKNYAVLMTYFKNSQTGYTSMIVHVAIAVLVFLEWISL